MEKIVVWDNDRMGEEVERLEGEQIEQMIDIDCLEEWTTKHINDGKVVIRWNSDYFSDDHIEAALRNL